jgi:hypothetical protein
MPFLWNPPFPQNPQYPQRGDLGISMLKEQYKSFIEVPPHKTTQVKRYSSIAPFVPQKHACKGKTSGLKKSPHLATLRVVFFSKKP